MEASKVQCQRNFPEQLVYTQEYKALHLPLQTLYYDSADLKHYLFLLVV